MNLEVQASMGMVEDSCASETSYTVVTFAPVQGFIGSSRKLRDLYGSSLLLSVLAKAIYDDAHERGFEVLSPALVNTARGTPNLLVINGPYKKGYGQDALQKTWVHILDATRQWLESNLPQFNYHWEPVWKQWQNHAWEYFHAQGSTISQARKHLALVKQQRAWSGINWSGESSTLGGSDAVARPSLGLVVDPRLISNAQCKDEATAFIRALQDLQPLGEPFAGVGEQLSLPELIKRLVTYPVIAKNAFKDEQLINVLPKRFDAIANSCNLVWFMADGDEVGKYLAKNSQGNQNQEAAALKSFSNAMRSWATKLYEDIPKHTGQKSTVVYAGGDDLLGALHDRPGFEGDGIGEPLCSNDLVNWLKIFPSIWREHGQNITVSMGLVYVSAKVPQREALEQVRLAESRAKALGRDRFALRLLFSGGQSIEWVCPWCELPRILNGYRDRENRQMENAHWGHLASDLISLDSRRAIKGKSDTAKAVANAIWDIYFPGLEAPKGLNQPLGDWLVALSQVFSRLLKPNKQEVNS